MAHTPSGPGGTGGGGAAALQVGSSQALQPQNENIDAEAHWSSAQGLSGLGPEV